MPTEKNFKENVIATIEEKKSGNFTARIRLVRWDVDGKQGDVKLEKRTYQEFRGKEMMGKVQGFTKLEWQMLLSKQDEIEKHFG